MKAERPLVRFENVQKSYDGEIVVVKDFNLDVAKGEFVTMLDPSGSGKNTCLIKIRHSLAHYFSSFWHSSTQTTSFP